MARILIDTNIWIDHLRGHAPASAWLAALDDEPIVSAITVAELYAGARSQRQETIVSRLLGAARCIPAHEVIARRAGAFVRLYGESHGVDLADALIAATAETAGAAIATRNRKHFPMLEAVTSPY